MWSSSSWRIKRRGDNVYLPQNLEKKGIDTSVNADIKKQENILSQGLKNQIIQQDIADANKTLDKDKLINQQKVSAGLKAEDAEYLQDVLDMDLYREYNINFENLPQYRLNKEKAILKKGPAHLKGCTKWRARRRWKKKQKGRVKAAEKLLKQHRQAAIGRDGGDRPDRSSQDRFSYEEPPGGGSGMALSLYRPVLRGGREGPWKGLPGIRSCQALRRE